MVNENEHNCRKEYSSMEMLSKRTNSSAELTSAEVVLFNMLF